MSVVVVAVCIIAALGGVLTWLLMERIPAPAWVCFGVAAGAALIIYSAGPGVLGG